MKIKLLASVLSATLLGGCAYPMPETHYNQLSHFIGYTQKCFEAEYMSPQMYADVKGAVSYALSTWDYDQDKLSKMINYSYSQASPTAPNCRQTEAMAYELIAKVQQRKTDQKENQQAWDNATKQMNMNKPVFCNTIGTMVTCN